MSFRDIRLLIKKSYTLDNAVLLIAIAIALSWLWGTMDTLQNNFRLQTQVNELQHDVELSKLEAENLELENQYFASQEYLELQARQRLNKALPGEHLLILPQNTVKDTASDSTQTEEVVQNNFQAWLSFFFANHK